MIGLLDDPTLFISAIWDALTSAAIVEGYLIEADNRRIDTHLYQAVHGLTNDILCPGRIV